MPGRTDLSRLSEAQICEIAGCSPQRRQHWVKRGLLDEPSAPGCGVRDALAVAQLLRMIEILGPTDGVVAWEQVRERLVQPFDVEQLDVLYDTQLKSATILEGDTDLRELLAHGRPVRLVELVPRRREVTEAVRRLEKALAGSKAADSKPAARRRSRRARGDGG